MFKANVGQFIAALFLFFSLSFWQPAWTQSAPPAVPGQIIVKINSGDKSSAPKVLGPTNLPAKVAAAFANHDAVVERTLDPAAGQTGKALRSGSLTNVFVVKTEDPAAVAALIAELQALPEVEYAEPDYLYFLGFVPNDPDFSRQWHLQNTGQYRLAGADIEAPAAWDINQGSASPIIAVIDSGIDFQHPDLANQIWTNPREAIGDANGDGFPGVAGFDDDGDGLVDEDSQGRQPGAPGYTNNLRNDDDENGFVDDLHGWDWVNNDAIPEDEHGHGTHCAGIAAAQTNNAVGVAGVCPQARIMPLKVFQTDGTASSSHITEAILYAHRNGADVISMSFGGPASSAMEDALEIAYSSAILVAASGNGGESEGPRYPASYPFVVGVGASDVAFDNTTGQYAELIAGFTNTLNADVCAPGVNIRSTLPGNQYASWSGTSMATPIVAGIAGLMISERDGGFWGPDQFRIQLIEAAGASVSKFVITFEDEKPVQRTVTLPRISALKALTMEPYPVLTITGTDISDPTGDVDGRPDAGEDIEIVATLRNSFGNAEGVVCTLTTTDPYLEVLQGTADFFSIGPNASEDNGGEPFVVRVAANAPHNRRARLDLLATATNSDVVRAESFFISIENGETISGMIMENRTLPSGRDYLVPESLLIPKGVTLRVEPGVVLRFYPGAELVVNGQFIAIGTASQPITFTSNGEGWQGIVFNDSAVDATYVNNRYQSGSTLQFCRIENMRRTIGIQIQETEPYFANNLIQNNTNATNTVSIYNSNMIFESSALLNNSGGTTSAGTIIRLNPGNARWNLIAQNSTKAVSITSGNFQGNILRSNTASLATTGGITIGFPLLCTVRGNTILPVPSETSIIRMPSASSGNPGNAQDNYWGPEVTAEMEAKGPNANISMIHDQFDNGSLGRLIYSPWLTEAPVITQAPPYVHAVEIPEVVGAEEFEFFITLNRDMNTSFPLAISFGPSVPYTQRIVTDGEWLSPRQWRGSYRPSIFTGDGIQHLRVSGGQDVEFGWGLEPDTSTTFEIDAAGLSGVTLQASGEAGRIDLTFQPVDEPDLAGYNIYRSTTQNGTYTKINSAIIYQTEYSDFAAPEGVTRWYKVSAVRTDFSESPLSDPASATALDGTPPVVQHTPPAGPIELPVPGITIQATCTDNVGVATVQIFWRTEGQPEFNSAAMLNPSGALYSFNLLESELSPPALEYYIEASDTLGNIGRFASPVTPHRLAVNSAPNEPPTQPAIRPVLHVEVSGLSLDPEGGTLRYRYEWALDGETVATHGPTTATEDTLREGPGISLVDGTSWTVTVTPIDDQDLEGPAITGTFLIGTSGQVTFEGWEIQ